MITLNLTQLASWTSWNIHLHQFNVTPVVNKDKCNTVIEFNLTLEFRRHLSKIDWDIRNIMRFFLFAVILLILAASSSKNFPYIKLIYFCTKKWGYSWRVAVINNLSQIQMSPARKSVHTFAWKLTCKFAYLQE